MATDYDAPRRNEADELGEDSLEELKARRAEAQSSSVDVDETDFNENLELPGANGLQATRELRRRHPACPVVIMSLNDAEVLRAAAADAGALAFIPKHALPSALLPILHRVSR